MTTRLPKLLLPALLSATLVFAYAQPPAGPSSMQDALMYLADQPATHTSLKEVWVAGWSARFIRASCMLEGPAGGWAYAKTRVAERSAGSRSLGRRVVILGLFPVRHRF